MADLKISQLTGATTPLAGTEVVPIVQSSTTKKVAVSDLTAGRAVSMDTVTTTGKVNLGNGPLGRSDVSVYYANRASASSTANLLVATSDAQGANIGGSIGLGGAVDGTSDRIPFAVWSGRKVTSGVGNYAGYALLTVSDAGAGYIDILSARADGNITLLVGNLVQGTAAKGVNFTANTPAAGMTSQLLNWYEEGTWTPTMTFSVSQGDLTYGVQTGRYTRIGRSVVLNCSVRVTETTASGNITITGLPFTSSSAIATATACFVDNVSGVSGAVVAQLNGASSTITLFYTGTGSSTQLSNTNTGTNSSFQFVLNYIV